MSDLELGEFNAEGELLFDTDHREAMIRFSFKPEYPNKYKGKILDDDGKVIGTAFIYLERRFIGVNVKIENAFWGYPS